MSAPELPKIVPDILMQDFDSCLQEDHLEFMHAVLLEIITDVLDSVDLAMKSCTPPIPIERRAEILRTVLDYVVNHYID